MKEVVRENWTQQQRRQSLERVKELIKEGGGLTEIILQDDMPDFEKYVSAKLGCSINVARDYISTLRGASIYAQKLKERKEKAKNE